MDGVYRPDIDSWLAAAVADACISGGTCADVGCGSGAITAVLASRCSLVVAIDVNEAACRACRSYDAVCCDAGTCLARIDALVSNPPYLPPEEPCTDWEAVAIYDCGIIPRLLRVIAVTRPSVVVMVISSLSRRDLVFEAMEALGYREVLRASAHKFFEDIEAVCWRAKYKYQRVGEDTLSGEVRNREL